jgi:hypothetical protein
LKASRSIASAILFLGVLLSISVISPVHAVKYQTGVNVGDSTYYNLGGSDAGGATAAHANVISVVGTNVTESFTYYYPGGGRLSRFFWIDIFSGSSWNFTSNFFFVISMGLQGGDPIFSSWINMTVMGPQSGACAGASRQVDSMGYIRTTQIIVAHWDKSTGLLCDYQTTDSSGGTFAMTTTNTTLWSSATASDVFTTAVEVTSFLGVPLLVLIVFVYLRRRRRRR